MYHLKNKTKHLFKEEKNYPTSAPLSLHLCCLHSCSDIIIYLDYCIAFMFCPPYSHSNPPNQAINMFYGFICAKQSARRLNSLISEELLSCIIAFNNSPLYKIKCKPASLSSLIMVSFICPTASIKVKYSLSSVIYVLVFSIIPWGLKL